MRCFACRNLFPLALARIGNSRHQVTDSFACPTCTDGPNAHPHDPQPMTADSQRELATLCAGRADLRRLAVETMLTHERGGTDPETAVRIAIVCVQQRIELGSAATEDDWSVFRRGREAGVELAGVFGIEGAA